jgi:1,2-diacylglycerol 3-alpha-glucosyltransferase
MTILLVTESFPPLISGVAIMVCRLALEMHRRGHTVAIITPSHTGSYAQEEYEGIPVYRVASSTNPFKRGRRTANPVSYLRISRIFKQVQPSMVHVHEPNFLAKRCIQQARKQGIPVVATQHFMVEGLLAYIPSLKVWHPLLTMVAKRSITRLYNRCQALTVPSKTLQKKVRTKSLRPIPQVISNGVDTDFFHPEPANATTLERYRLPNVPLLGYIGRVDPEKNLHVILQALAEIRRHGTELPFLCVGGGNELDALKQQAIDLGISQQVHFLPPTQNREELAAIYHCIALFCLPSTVETESLVALEAMASGIPVITARGGAVVELVTNEITGLVVDSLYPKDWALALQRLLSDGSARIAMGERARQRALERSVIQSFDQFESLYQSLLPPSPSSPKGISSHHSPVVGTIR